MDAERVATTIIDSFHRSNSIYDFFVSKRLRGLLQRYVPLRSGKQCNAAIVSTHFISAMYYIKLNMKHQHRSYLPV